MAGFQRLFKDGTGDRRTDADTEPSFSHFTSMAYCTAAPNSGENYGWVGRLADTMAPDVTPNSSSISRRVRSLAVRARKHVPVVFDDPNRFSQEKFHDDARCWIPFLTMGRQITRRGSFIDAARSARAASALVRKLVKI